MSNVILLRHFSISMVAANCLTVETFSPQSMARLMRFLVASLVRKSLRMEIVEMLSDLKVASPLLSGIRLESLMQQ